LPAFGEGEFPTLTCRGLEFGWDGTCGDGSKSRRVGFGVRVFGLVSLSRSLGFPVAALQTPPASDFSDEAADTKFTTLMKEADVE